MTIMAIIAIMTVIQEDDNTAVRPWTETDFCTGKKWWAAK